MFNFEVPKFRAWQKDNPGQTAQQCQVVIQILDGPQNISLDRG